MSYNWQLTDWPNFTYELTAATEKSLFAFAERTGRVSGLIEGLTESTKMETVIEMMVSEADKNAYYSALNAAQYTLDVTTWIDYFVQACLDAQIRAEEKIKFTLKKSKLFDRFENEMNERQLKVIRRMLVGGPDNFGGGISAKKYMVITKASKATATRDLQGLAEMGVLVPEGGGRSVRYKVNI